MISFVWFLLTRSTLRLMQKETFEKDSERTNLAQSNVCMKIFSHTKLFAQHNKYTIIKCQQNGLVPDLF